jgi:creatinine amidohydrolase/Fe(II)-dependent formamide hydrolase-like protein
MNDDLKSSIVARIQQCFPFMQGTKARANLSWDFEVIEIPAQRFDSPWPDNVGLGFSVDTAVEEHGPHLPLATDTIQSYAVLQQLANEIDAFEIGPPVEYGHLTWGLPFGMSIDLTADLLTPYVAGFVNALLDWSSPRFLYVVDVHGSLVHRTAIQDGLKQSHAENYSFRWLHEPLVEFAAERGDQHAGGVETALVDYISEELVDPKWWPDRITDLINDQMSFQQAVDLTPDLAEFIRFVESRSLNGIVGDIRNYALLDAADLLDRMLTVARDDVCQLQSNGK